jgi:hypothetical protein
MSQFKDINDFEAGQVFGTKKGKKMEVIAVHRDVGTDNAGGSVELKMYVHRDSQNCKAYGWGHNTKYFISFIRLDGRDGFLNKLKTEGWSLKQ